MRPRNRSDFEIGIICALTLEAQAVDAILDEEYKGFGKQPGDTNAYTTGRIGTHNVVLAHMPGMGKSIASSGAASLRSSFIGVKVVLVVGICGGVPGGPQKEVLLGDVIISDEVIQHDFGKQYPDSFELKNTIKDSLGRPNQEIRALLAKLRIPRQLEKLGRNTSQHLEILQERLGKEFQYPGPEQDRLFESSYRHRHHRRVDSGECKICDRCESKTDPICEEAQESSCHDLGCNGKLVYRGRLAAGNPQLAIHIGTIASGDTVMKSGEDRDEIARKYRVIAFEMEAAGVWDNFPCIVIKGVCDYADSHKSNTWQHYTAAAAAACAKALLEEWDTVTQDHNPNPYLVLSTDVTDVKTEGQQLSTSSQNTGQSMISGTSKKQHYNTSELQSLISNMNPNRSQIQPLAVSNILLTDIYISSEVLIRLQSWWSSPSSELLWIQEEIDIINESSTGRGILALARKASIPVAAWSYNHGHFSRGENTDHAILNQMMLSLIQQLSQNLPPEFQSSTDFSIERFRKLDGSHEYVGNAINLIRDLLELGVRPLIVVIEGLQMLDQAKDQDVQSGLRALLQSLQHPHNSLASKRTPVKTLLITPGQTRFLINEVRLTNRCESLQSSIHKEALLTSAFARDLLVYRP
ncbi:purine and uridine phosphorylase [Hypoxylon sp. NC0597]|nr:purine and uridine phosphorylase [Hypoxylon sp. NC0597]